MQNVLQMLKQCAFNISARNKDRTIRDIKAGSVCFAIRYFPRLRKIEIAIRTAE